MEQSRVQKQFQIYMEEGVIIQQFENKGLSF